MFVLIVIVLLTVLAVHLFRKFFRIPKLSNLTLVSGGVKTGKSSLSCYFALKAYKRVLFQWKVTCFLSKFFRFVKKTEKPLLYSNVPLSVDYVPLTPELVMRTERFAYKSVIYIQEASLFADSFKYKDDKVNDSLKLFNKLIAHETKGGQLFYDTQSCSDLHFAIKRCLQSYFYIHHSIKVPFFLVCYVRELLYSDENGVANTFDDDVEYSGMRRILVPKSIWKKFDCYTYSALTDDLPVNTKMVKGRKLKNLKTKEYLDISKFSRESGGLKVEKVRR